MVIEMVVVMMIVVEIEIWRCVLVIMMTSVIVVWIGILDCSGVGGGSWLGSVIVSGIGLWIFDFGVRL